MASFKDSAGREWIVRVDVPQMKLVRERCQFSLGKILADNLAGLKQLASEPELLVDVLFVLCLEQAEKIPISAEQFGRALIGDAIEDAFDALIRAYADFCPSRQAAPIHALLAKNKELGEAATKLMTSEIEKATLESILKSSPGNAAASVESIPAPAG